MKVSTNTIGMSERLVNRRSLINKYFREHPEIYKELIKIEKTNSQEESTNTLKSNYIFNFLKQKIGEFYNVDVSFLGSGTNRMAVMIDGYAIKIALDNDGCKDNLREHGYAKKLQPYVTKVYECTIDGLILVAEYVECLTKKEFVFQTATIRQILRDLSKDYIIGDIGTGIGDKKQGMDGDNSFMSSFGYDQSDMDSMHGDAVGKSHTNWGKRNNGEYVILDFAYIFDVSYTSFTCPEDGAPLEYTQSYSKLRCPRCGKEYDFLTVATNLGSSRDDNLDDIRRSSYHITKEEEMVEYRPDFERVDKDITLKNHTPSAKSLDKIDKEITNTKDKLKNTQKGTIEYMNIKGKISKLRELYNELKDEYENEFEYRQKRVISKYKERLRGSDELRAIFGIPNYDPEAENEEETVENTVSEHDNINRLRSIRQHRCCCEERIDIDMGKKKKNKKQKDQWKYLTYEEQQKAKRDYDDLINHRITYEEYVTGKRNKNNTNQSSDIVEKDVENVTEEVTIEPVQEETTTATPQPITEATARSIQSKPKVKLREVSFNTDGVYKTLNQICISDEISNTVVNMNNIDDVVIDKIDPSKCKDILPIISKYIMTHMYPSAILSVTEYNNTIRDKNIDNARFVFIRHDKYVLCYLKNKKSINKFAGKINSEFSETIQMVMNAYSALVYKFEFNNKDNNTFDISMIDKLYDDKDFNKKDDFINYFNIVSNRSTDKQDKTMEYSEIYDKLNEFMYYITEDGYFYTDEKTSNNDESKDETDDDYSVLKDIIKEKQMSKQNIDDDDDDGILEIEPVGKELTDEELQKKADDINSKDFMINPIHKENVVDFDYSDIIEGELDISDIFGGGDNE